MGKLYWIMRMSTVESQGPYKQKWEAGEWESVTEEERKTPHRWIRSRQMEPRAKQCGWPLLTGKGKATDSPAASPEGTQPYQHLDFSSSKPFQISDLQSYTTINLSCPELLRLW